MAGRQLSLRAFFRQSPKSPSKETPEASSTTPQREEKSDSTINLKSTFGYNEERATEPHISEKDASKEKRHQQFVQRFGLLEEQEHAAKKRRVDEPDDSMIPETPQLDISMEDETMGERLNDDGYPSTEAAEYAESPELSSKSSMNLARFSNASNQKSSTTKKGKGTVSSDKKYTPLELQVFDLKERYPDVLLVIEVGYKFRFFGEDAKVASRILHIAHFIDRNFYTASIPVHRLAVHVRRLVAAGYKVGVVRQTETAALKAAGSNRNAPFQRELTQLYTKGTFVDEMTTSEVENEAHGVSSSNYLMCIVEENRGGTAADELVRIGIVAVQTATGDVMYDSFDDGYMRSELETRILHIEPSEILISTSLSKPTEKLIQHMLLQRTASIRRDSARIERMPTNDSFCTDGQTALSYVTDFYIRQGSQDLISEIVKLPDIIIKSLASTLRYLGDFGLEDALQLTKYFVHFSSRSHMLLNGNTLANLEIYRNSTDYTEKGSLFWILNHTRTSFGKRLLKKWIGRPLIDEDQLNERINAVDELLVTQNPKKAEAQALLKQLPDLDKGLCRIHYRRSSPSEMVHVLDALLKVANAFYGVQDLNEHKFTSPLLERIFAALPSIRDAVMGFRSNINTTAIEKPDCKLHLFKSEEIWPALPEQKKIIAGIEKELDQYLEEVRKSTKISALKFVTVAGIEYLLEVKNSDVKKVPPQWIKISGTKAVSRFHTPHLLQILKKRERHRELLTLAAEEAYKNFLQSISEKYGEFRDVIQYLAQLDCLLSLATVAGLPNYVKPKFTSRTQLKVVNGRHPMVEQFLSGSYVPNDIDFDTDNSRTLILTGPNMGGKSCYIRQVALITIMGQIGSYVPAESAELGIFDAVFTRMGVLDNMMAGESTFMLELHETSDIMKQATPRSLVILDELGRGTSTHDGMAIAYAVLYHFITKIQSITLFVTHYPALAELAYQFPESTKNGYMSFLEDKEGDIPNIVFLYKLVEGIATKSYGLNVARLADLPRQVLKTAKQKSEEMETMLSERMTERKEQLLQRLLNCIVTENITEEFKENVTAFLSS
ncbi:muts domain V-domain-containing protein [Radiomyces spectabilis]|uniref:muts domain V-domain-containing protein n=1 Tax=Radiomyces spectabilis TaxID=64574 RepID=UPI002220EFE8|nr:muts domain V-domain-containing protein [Radiomyces spectabilis]KAI8369324.1 muts domain V-domain-containing protein [Radiomyces spectabilis]